MNIKILDSWLRDYLKTEASPQKIGELLSLSSVSIERIENYGNDYIYDIEVTTNRPDLMSITGIAREAAAILPRFGIKAEFLPPKTPKVFPGENLSIKIINDPKLVNRVLAVSMDVKINPSPKIVRERLETSGIRSLNNVIDVTNYVMRIVGHPAHVFDLDRLNSKELIIREAKKEEQIETLDNKIYSLKGGEIVAENDKGEVVDLLGIMGLANSVVTDETQRILFFIDNNDPYRIRKTSMDMGIRTEAATINEKGIDPEIALEALTLGISLFEKYAQAKNVSQIVDIYPNKPVQRKITVSFDQIRRIIGVDVDDKQWTAALGMMGFITKIEKGVFEISVPSFRLSDIRNEEDVIEEIARIYGYHKLPSILPPLSQTITARSAIDRFYWESKIKQAMKYWGFTECYTYSFVSEEMFDGPIDKALKIANPLTNDYIYMRNSLVPSLLQVISDNKQTEEMALFEISNIYLKRAGGLPRENLSFAGVLKKEKADFFKLKGLIEQVLADIGVETLTFKPSTKGGSGASVFIKSEYLGEIELLDTDLVDFELDLDLILEHASNKKVFKPFAKYPPMVEDLTLNVNERINTQEIIDHVLRQSNLITAVTLKDTYKNSRTFHIIFQDLEKNLTKSDVTRLRGKIIASLAERFKADIK